MNLMVSLLTANTAIVGMLVERSWDEQQDPDITWLRDALDETQDALVTEVGTRLREVLRHAPNEAVGDAVAGIFLGVVKQDHWSDRLYEAEGLPPTQSAEWVTFVAGPDVAGLTLPDDDSPIQKLSFFTTAPGYRTVDIALTGPPSVIATTQEGHCQLPTRALCPSPGQCGSECFPRKVLNSGGRGLICLCEHLR